MRARAPSQGLGAWAASQALRALPVATLVLITWPIEGSGSQAGLWPEAGLDSSWHAALAMAAHTGLSFGSDLDWTYGPLGFLHASGVGYAQLWYADTSTLAFIYTLALRVGLVYAVFTVARRDYGPITGFLIAWVVSALVGDALPAVVLIVCARMIAGRSARRRTELVVGAGAALAALELLIKLSIGIEVIALVGLFALAVERGRVRHILIGLGAFFAIFLLGWSIAGQNWGALPDYFRYAEQTVGGYSSAMGIESPDLGWQHSVALIGFGFGVAAALQMTATAPRRARLALLALWTAFAFLSFKEAFVRHDIGHGVYAFHALLGGFVAFRWAPRRGVGLALLCALAAICLAAENRGISAAVDPSASVSTAFDQVRILASGARRNQITREGRQIVQANDTLDPQTLALLRGHTVHAYPQETAAVWAYQLRWRPLPVFQSYGVYTTVLDELNARFVTSARAPERIIVQSPTRGGAPIDGRVLAFDEPLTTRMVLCRYVELRTTAAWQVLGRGANRCEPDHLIVSERAGWGQPVSVPNLIAPSGLIFVRILGAGVSGWERVKALVYKPRERHIVLDGAAHRLVADTAADGLVIRAAPGVDFSPPFAVAPNPQTIAVTKDGQSGPGPDSLRYDFYWQPFRAGPRPPGK